VVARGGRRDDAHAARGAQAAEDVALAALARGDEQQRERLLERERELFVAVELVAQAGGLSVARRRRRRRSSWYTTKATRS